MAGIHHVYEPAFGTARPGGLVIASDLGLPSQERTSLRISERQIGHLDLKTRLGSQFSARIVSVMA